MLHGIKFAFCLVVSVKLFNFAAGYKTDNKLTN